MRTPALAELDAGNGIDTASGNRQGATPAADGPGRDRRLKEVVVTKLTPTPLDELETPDLVREMVGRVIDLPPEQEKACEREFKLSYYFEGFWVALAPSKRGPVVVASGPDNEVLAVLAGLPKAERKTVTLVTPQSLRAIIAELAVTPPRPRSTDQ